MSIQCHENLGANQSIDQSTEQTLENWPINQSINRPKKHLRTVQSINQSIKDTNKHLRTGQSINRSKTRTDNPPYHQINRSKTLSTGVLNENRALSPFENDWKIICSTCGSSDFRSFFRAESSSSFFFSFSAFSVAVTWLHSLATFFFKLMTIESDLTLWLDSAATISSHRLEMVKK